MKVTSPTAATDPKRPAQQSNSLGAAQPAAGHSPSSDVVNMMRPSATQAAP